jgi:hypothetical protein
MLSASYASKISHGNKPCGTHQEVCGLRRKIANKGQKRLFLAVLIKALAKSGVEVFQNKKNFPVKFKVFMLY